ncbi:MAG: class I SAM-dependent methyltransferase [Candidatus Cyclobacteriaceae bacterium M2_1C_046]
MTIDHSLTYKELKFKNIPHFLRLKKILKIINNENHNFEKNRYLDIGCSNGYITNIITKKFDFNYAKGLDYNNENLEMAKELYRNIDFDIINLNFKVFKEDEKFNLVTCFETLEHVGDLNQALENVLFYKTNLKSTIIISVPIEIGFWGINKFLIKKFVYRYNLKELPGNVSKYSYFLDLLRSKRISRYRDKRNGWKTHFGFDYRDIDEYLKFKNISYNSINSFTTRFYIIN